MRTGRRNLITDVPGLKVGNAVDAGVRTGTTVLTADAPFVAGVDIRGGAPGTREIALLAPDKTVGQVDALVLSGGSAFGLDAAAGVAEALEARGRGFGVGDIRVPIVPAAILFDLANGGDKSGRRPYRDLGAAALAAAGEDFGIGSEGAGFGALTADLKGGLGSASTVLEGGTVVGALVAVNAVGSVRIPGQEAFWAWPWEVGDEFGALPPPTARPNVACPVKPWPEGPRQGPESTTIAIVATSASLDKAGATRLAVAAQDGLARAILPAHTLRDGDLVFAVATGEGPPAPLPLAESLGHAAATTLARAVARGVYAARSAPGDLRPAWSARSGPAQG